MNNKRLPSIRIFTFFKIYLPSIIWLPASYQVEIIKIGADLYHYQYLIANFQWVRFQLYGLNPILHYLPVWEALFQLGLYLFKPICIPYMLCTYAYIYMWGKYIIFVVCSLFFRFNSVSFCHSIKIRFVWRANKSGKPKQKREKKEKLKQTNL